MPTIVWTDYLKYRAALRGFDLTRLEEILLHSTERYFDNETRRIVVVGRHDQRLVIIPCDSEGEEIIPVTIHDSPANSISNSNREIQRMNKTQVRYFEKEDILHLVIGEGPEARSLELAPNITVELGKDDELIGVEILNASSFLRDAVLESIQARTLK